MRGGHSPLCEGVYVPLRPRAVGKITPAERFTAARTARALRRGAVGCRPPLPIDQGRVPRLSQALFSPGKGRAGQQTPEAKGGRSSLGREAAASSWSLLGSDRDRHSNGATLLFFPLRGKEMRKSYQRTVVVLQIPILGDIWDLGFVTFLHKRRLPEIFIVFVFMGCWGCLVVSGLENKLPTLILARC